MPCNHCVMNEMLEVCEYPAHSEKSPAFISFFFPLSQEEHAELLDFAYHWKKTADARPEARLEFMIRYPEAFDTDKGAVGSFH